MRARQAKKLAALVILFIGCDRATPKAQDSVAASPMVVRRHDNVSDAAVDSTPAGVIRDYYAAIQSRRYEDAYALWSDAGKASGQTAKQFAAGFAQTASVKVAVDDSARIEGAAGSQYATVRVIVDAALTNGDHQRFVGTYTLRKSMVDGASPEQRKWRIYSAALNKK